MPTLKVLGRAPHHFPMGMWARIVLGEEEQILNGIWVGLLGLEAAMVLRPKLLALFRAIVGSRMKPKVQ